MDLNDYQNSALYTAISQDIEYDVSHFGFGLVAEAGELAGIFQKYFRGDKRYRMPMESKDILDVDWEGFTDEAIDKVKLELGDVLWHVAVLAETFGFTLEDIAEANIKKLHKRMEEGTIKGDGDYR